MPRTVFVTDPTHREHYSSGHDERPERLDAILAHLGASGLRAALDERSPREATDDELLAVHAPELLATVASAAKYGAWLDPDTYTTPLSAAIARRAVGAALVGLEAVLGGEADNAFIATRPPGHHATHDRAMGFCLFNAVAVVAAAALRAGIERLAIVDWDVHHGNGTQAIFDADPRVLYFSTHASPFYPGTGAVQENGSGAARGTKVNVPLPHGTSDAGFVGAYEQLAVPALVKHRPQLVLVSCGWDAHARDPLGTLKVTTEGYTRAAALVIDAAGQLCDGRIILTLEGGYDTHALAWCASALVELLLDETPTPDPEPVASPPGPDVSALFEQVRRAAGLRAVAPRTGHT
jgi:acetoin utilization deacetylase AcuC-like enzyme